MTKCHILFLLTAALLLTACKPAPKGPSLSEYGSHSQASLEIQFEPFVQELLALPADEARQRQESRLAEVAGDSVRWRELIALEEKFLLDPNSPYRDEERYLPVAEAVVESPFATEKQLYYHQYILPRLQYNRPGTKAADFGFLTPRGRRSTLYQTIDARRPKHTLLFFSNPGCPNCKEITDALSGDTRVQAHIQQGDLLVVNIYPDADVETWLDYLPEYPAEWICGCDEDQVLNAETIYWLRAIPSLYLLDEEKRVILKDAPLERLMAALRQD